MNKPRRTDIEFFRDLTKGKIAELIFEQMFRKIGTCIDLEARKEINNLPESWIPKNIQQEYLQLLKKLTMKL